MKVVLEGIPGRADELQDCFSGCLESLLAYHGQDLALLHFDEWHFALEGSGPDRFRVAAQTRDHTTSLARFGVALQRQQEEDFATGWARICAELDQGRPLLALVDTEPLRACYYPGQPLHTAHTVVVNGYGEGQVHLVDPSPYTAFAGGVPLGVFALAWQAVALGGAPWVWCGLRVPARLPPRPRPELVRCLRRNLAGMVEGGRAGWGLAGVRQLAGWLEETIGWQGVLQAATLGQVAQLKWVGLARRHHARFLGHAGEELGSPEVAALGEELRAVAQEWMVIRNLGLKGHRHPRTDLVRRLVCRLESLAEWEGLLLGRLEGALAGG